MKVCLCVCLSVCLFACVSGECDKCCQVVAKLPLNQHSIIISPLVLLHLMLWFRCPYICTHTDGTHCFGRMLSLSHSALTRRRSQQSLTQIHTHTYAHNEECMVCEYLEQICVFIQLQTGKPRVRYFSLDFDFEFDLLNISQTNKIQFKYMQTNINKPRFNSSVFYQ